MTETDETRPRRVTVHKRVGGQRVGKAFECCMNTRGNCKCSKCDPCTHVDPRTGEACQHKACLDFELCKLHLEIVFKVAIRESTIAGAGLGLFAHKHKAKPKTNGSPTVVFRAGEFICPYGGVVMDAHDYNRLYDFWHEGKFYENTGPYGIQGWDYEKKQHDHTKIVDAICLRRAGAYANDPRDARRTNALVNVDGLYATKTIHQGDEVFVNYGEDYWAGGNNLDVDTVLEEGDDDAATQGSRGVYTLG